MTSEAFNIALKPSTYIDLLMQLRKVGDDRNPEDIVPVAVRYWLAANGAGAVRGYQWKELFLPHGTELRVRFRYTYHYAIVEGDRIMADGESVTPRSWLLGLTGTVRNPWRDIWVRRTVNGCWTHASMWRSSHQLKSVQPYADRRRQVRRSSDL
ncbi:hypothetical protein [Pseudoduganella lutea]|uniref:Uncharacterized protein n=1 Tax=Pseudoduganella lutea TaxID=321985 RepID=A0A4P6L7B1_9BURK|nr:hypothetical protein [Pseudoduganella lutea]QBE66802.1 hypothetical protein EWM63_30715 [Pseudoduganella lutea]